MAIEAPTSSRSFRAHTLRVVDLLSTRVQSVRIELIGNGSGNASSTEPSPLTRLGAVLVYLPVLLLGYLLVLAALMSLLAPALGWTLTLFLFGAIHLAGAAWGLSRGRGPGAAQSYDVVDPQLADSPAAPRPGAPQAAPGAAGATGTAAALAQVSRRDPPLPHAIPRPSRARPTS